MSAQITLNEAKSMTHAFQNSTIGANQTFAGLVDKTNLLTLLNQEGCTGLRIYNALNDDGKITFVFFGNELQQHFPLLGSSFKRFG